MNEENSAIQQVNGDSYIPVDKNDERIPQTLADWHREVGKIYRDARRGKIPAQRGTKLAFIARIGSQIAETLETQKQLIELQRQLEMIRVNSPALLDHNQDSINSTALDGQLLPIPKTPS